MPSRKAPDLARSLFVAACAALLFAYGVVVGVYHTFPYDWLYFGLNSVQAAWEELPVRLGGRPTLHLEPARHEGAGVTKNSGEDVAPGLTLLVGFFEDSNELRLIGQEGELVRRWPVQFSELFPDPAHIEPSSRRPATDWNIDLHGALALPDGSVLFNFEYAGLVKLGRCGAVEWTLPHMTHHFISLANDGSFWVGGRRWRTARVPALVPLEAPYWEDMILNVSEDGEILAEISVPQLFPQNGLLALLLATTSSSVSFVGDSEIVHLNDVEQLTPELASRFPEFSAGDLLLSLRQLNLIMVVDPLTEEVKWHQTGPWIRQHDPDFLPNGRISVFNNNVDQTETGRLLGGSNIIEIDPETREAEVVYGDEPGETMYTIVRGKHQQLANGNILLTETEAGRVLEVTRDGDIVWEYVNRYDEGSVASLTGAVRYSDGYFTVDDWTCG